jgi:predicted transcriptional regulator
MTTKDVLHHLVDESPEDQTELARVLLEDLRDAADVDGLPLDAETLASVERGLADIAAGRVKPLDEYKRERGL